MNVTAKKERSAMMAIAGGMLGALALSYAMMPEERSEKPMTIRQLSAHADSPARRSQENLSDGSFELAPEEVAQCRKAIVAASGSGIIRERPYPNRINVDDQLWRELPSDAQGRIMQALACDAWQTVAPPQDQKVVAHSSSTGRLLSTLRGNPI